MVERESRHSKIIEEWVSISIPESFYNSIQGELRRTNEFASVSELTRHLMKEWLYKSKGIKKK